MGMVLVFAALIGLGISAVAAVVGIVLWFIARSRGRGPLPPFILASVLIPIIMAGVLVMQASGHESRGGAPTAEEYEMWMAMAFSFGLVPGSGLFLGGTGIFIYSFFAKDPRAE